MRQIQNPQIRMKISALRIKNFKAIKNFEISNLGKMVVIAGPNGCGKSCIFDAIRLLKSVYGGYQDQEYQQWFSEFHIPISRDKSSLLSLFNDRKCKIEIESVFCLDESEKSYLRANAETILTERAWRAIAPNMDHPEPSAFSLAGYKREYSEEVKERAKSQLDSLIQAIEQPEHKAFLTISPECEDLYHPSIILEIVFSYFDPKNLGIIDYHGPNRNYSRDRLDTVNFRTDALGETMKNSALYNYSNKYSNLKSEIASSYIRQLLANKSKELSHSSSNTDLPHHEDLTETLIELFAAFFPSKSFMGPQPTRDGKLTFPINTSNGSTHDIDELSSGEKEIVYGYLRLRNSAPRNSVLLLDEPELHLNPRLLSGLASFYHKHLGLAMNSQLWLITHSDTLVRETIGKNDFSAIHLQPASVDESVNQAIPVEPGEGIERLVIELVGDLAAYKPGEKVVVFESDGDLGFDAWMTRCLFPEFGERTNQISGGNRDRLRKLHFLLDESRKSGKIENKYYFITDSDGLPAANGPGSFSWDVYHIENYLLDFEVILTVIKNLMGKDCPFNSSDSVKDAIGNSARDTVNSLVAHQMRLRINSDVEKALSLRFDNGRCDISRAIKEAIDSNVTKVMEISRIYTEERLLEIEAEIRTQLDLDLENGSWLRTFRGRDVLRRFVGKHVTGVNYEPFRNQLVAQMQSSSVQPIGMRLVIDQILREE
jgi:predicted ATPase